jgi:hypothetical protein
MGVAKRTRKFATARDLYILYTGLMDEHKLTPGTGQAHDRSEG